MKRVVALIIAAMLMGTNVMADQCQDLRNQEQTITKQIKEESKRHDKEIARTSGGSMLFGVLFKAVNQDSPKEKELKEQKKQIERQINEQCK